MDLRPVRDAYSSVSEQYIGLFDGVGQGQEHDTVVKAGFTEVQRLRQEIPERPDRKYAAIAARAS